LDTEAAAAPRPGAISTVQPQTRASDTTSAPAPAPAIPATFGSFGSFGSFGDPAAADASAAPVAPAVGGGGGGFQSYLQRRATVSGPPRAGDPTIQRPRGSPDCLAGLKFVVTGVLDSLEREEAQNYIVSLGGRCTGSVSGATDFLVAGMDAGEAKLAKAKANAQAHAAAVAEAAQASGSPKKVRIKATRIVDEAGLFDLVREKSDAAGRMPVAPKTSATAGVSAGPNSLPPLASKSGSPAGFDAESSPDPFPASLPSQRPTAAAGRAVPTSQPASIGGDSALWNDRYRPRVPADLIGNAQSVNFILAWLAAWPEVHLHGVDPASPALAAGRGFTGAARTRLSKLLEHRALLISGPPGVGKTSTALVVAAAAGLRPVEQNASDSRAQSAVRDISGVTTSNHTINSLFGPAAAKSPSGRPLLPSAPAELLIMDEVDGMGAGDRGGVVALADLAKTTLKPMLCLCNDSEAQKMRPLKSACGHLPFSVPTAQEAGCRLVHICKLEGLAVSEQIVAQLLAGTNGDIRAALNVLEAAARSRRLLNAESVAAAVASNAKDISITDAEAARRLFGSSCAGVAYSFNQRFDDYFVDTTFVPYRIQESYPRYCGTLDALAAAADAISLGHTVSDRISQTQDYSLSRPAGLLGALYPTARLNGGAPQYAQFPGVLGKISSLNKHRRCLAESTAPIAAAIGFVHSKHALASELLSALEITLSAAVAADPKDGATRAHDLGLTPDDAGWILTDLMPLRYGKARKTPYQEVPAKNKAAFTRTLSTLAAEYKEKKSRAKKAK
jgi:replication factor C subunit 1